jgi:PAS domain S-box-containing protein
MIELAKVLFQESSDPFLLVDARNSCVKEANPAAARLCGMMRESMIGQPVEAILTTTDPELAAALHDAIVSGNRLAETKGYQTAAALKIAVKVTPAPHGVALIRIDEEKKKKSNDSDIRYSRLFKNNLAGVFRVTLGGTILECNDAYARIFGFAEASEVVQRSMVQHYFDPAEREEKVKRLVRDGRLINNVARMKRLDGTEIWILERIYLLDGLEGEQQFEGTIFDITEQKKAEVEFVRQHTLLNSIFDSLPDLLFYKDAAGKYRQINRTFERYYNVRTIDCIGKSTREMFPALADELLADDDRVYATKKPHRVERWHVVGEERRLVETLLIPLLDSSGEPFGVLGVGRDITDRRRSSQHQLQSSKMEAIGQLAGGVAHDFNNLLTIIIGNLSVARFELSPTSPVQECLTDCEQAAKRAADLTGQLLGFARRAPLSMTPTDLNRIVQSVVTQISRSFDKRIEIVAPKVADLWTIEAAGTQLEKVLINLCNNARDAMPDGGRLTIGLENTTIGEELPANSYDARPGEFVRIVVEDSGTGIPADSLQRIFEPFYTTKPVGQGTGLGLAMVFGIVRQHHGWIECDSLMGRGTRFTIYLPRTNKEKLKGIRLPSSEAQGKETILLVDDEPLIRNLGKLTLEQYGYRVLVAEDGQRGVDVYRANPGAIAAVVLDLTMPNMTGQEALRELLKIDPNVKVLFASGYSADSFDSVDSPGVRGFLQKPYRPEDLAQAVRQAISGIRNGHG